MSKWMCVIRTTIRIEWATFERVASPMLFGLALTLLFYFAVGENNSSENISYVVAQIYLTLFMSLQLVYARSFTPEQEDGAFLLMRRLPIPPEAWFLAKWLVVCITSFAIAVFSFALAEIFNPVLGGRLFQTHSLVVLGLVLMGLSACGVLISTFLQRSHSQPFLFALIYYPLTTPVLLAGTQSSLAILQNEATVFTLIRSWCGILLLFDLVYIGISTLLFSEVIKDS